MKMYGNLNEEKGTSKNDELFQLGYPNMGYYAISTIT